MRTEFLPISRKLAGAALVAALLAGCSSSSLRFEDGFYAGADTIATGTVPTPRADVQSGGQIAQPNAIPPGGYPAAGGSDPLAQPYPGDVANNRYALAPATVQPSVQRGALPETQQPSSDAITTGATPQEATSRPRGWSGEGAPRVRLSSGETIYSVSRRYGVPAEEIMRVNNITDASRVTPGQELIIPGYSRGGNVPVAPAQLQQASNPTPSDPRYTERSLNEQAALLGQQSSASAPQPAAQTASGSYTVKPGDTLSRVSRETGLSVAQLRQYNDISGDTIRVGQTLSLGSGVVQQAAAPQQATGTDPQQTAATPPATQSQSIERAAAPAPAQVETGPASYTPPAQEADNQEVSSQVGNEVAAVTPEATGIGKLRWPVRGQVITPFGAQDGNVRNDGIDISVPEGSEIRAAENGVVIYSGSGLREYGNTALIRHDNGLVTVYGHASELLVNRGDTVTRGQVIAKSGMSGTAQQPKLHFEVRENATPVNPTTFLE